MQSPNQNNPNNRSRHVSFSGKNEGSLRLISKSGESQNNPSLDKTLGDDGNWHSLQSINIDSTYDLSKSMMRRFPGRKQFMGNHLELVCLFQAVEIQRLTAALQQYHVRYFYTNKVRLKEAEKMPLDRQSYEIQIKEMTDVINTFKMQLDSKNSEFQGFQRDTNSFIKSLQEKYEKAIKIIDTMHRDNSLLQQKLSYFELQNRKLEISRQQMSSSLRQFHNISLQRSQMQIQIRRVQDSLVIVSKQKQSYQKQLHQLNSRVSQLQDIEQQNEEYQNKLVMISQEIERLNIMVKQRNKEKLELTQKNTDFETKIRKLQTQILQIRHQLENQRIKQKNYDSNIEDKSHRIDSLMQRNKEYDRMVIGLKEQVNKKIFQLQNLQTANRQLSNRLTQASNQLKNNLQSSRHKQDSLKVQLQRVNKQRVAQIHQYDNKIKTLVQQRQHNRRIYENQSNNFNVKLRNLQQKIRQIQGEKQRVLKQKDNIIQRMQQQIQLNMMKSTEIQHKDKIIEHQIDRVIQEVRQKDIIIKRLNEQKQLMVRNMQQIHKKCSHLELVLQEKARQFNIHQQQKMVLTRKIHELTNQLEAQKRKLMQQSSIIRNYEKQLQHMSNANNHGKASQQKLKFEIRNLQANMQKMRVQNTSLRQNQERLRNNQQTIRNNSEKIVGQINRRNEQIVSLKTKLVAFQRQLNEANMHIQRTKELKNQNQSIKNALRQRNQSIKKLQVQINQLNQRQRQNQQQKIDIQGKLKLVTSQLQRIQNTVHNKNQHNHRLSNDTQYLRNENGQLVQQIQSLRQKYQDIAKINQNLHGELQHSQKYYENLISVNAELKSTISENLYLKDQIQLNLKKIQLLQSELIQVIKLLENLSEDQCERFKISTGQFKIIRQEIAKLKNDLKSQYLTGVDNIKNHSQDLIGNVIETTRNNRILQQNYNRKIRQLQEHIAKDQKQISQLQNHKMTAESKIQQLRASMNEKSRQNDYHKQKQKQLKHQIQKQRESIIIWQTKFRNAEDHKKDIESQDAKKSNKQNFLQLQKENESLRRSIQQFESQKFQLIKKIRNIQSQISQKEQIMEELESEINQQNRKTETSFEQILKQKDKLYSRNIELIKQNKTLSGTIQQLEAKLQQDLIKIEQLTERVSHLGLQLQRKNQQLDHQTNVINRTQQNRINDKRAYQNMINSMKSEAKTQVQSKDVYSKRLQQAENKISQMTRQVKQKAVTIKNYKASLDQSQQKNTMLLEHCLQIENMNNNLQNQWKNAIFQMQKAKKIAANLNDSLTQVFKELDLLNQRLQESDNYAEKLQVEQEKNYKYQQLILVQQQTIKNLEIQKQFLQKQRVKGQYLYENYQKKIQALIKQFDKYEKVIEKVRRQNVELKNSNYDISLQLKKTQLFQRKIDVLNQEIDRLSKNNDSLCEQVSTCHLSIGEQSSLQRRIKQHLILFPLLFCQIESLRNRLEQKQDQLNKVHRQSLPKS